MKTRTKTSPKKFPNSKYPRLTIRLEEPFISMLHDLRGSNGRSRGSVIRECIEKAHASEFGAAKCECHRHD